MTPRGVLWDVGNVIVRWSPRTLYSKIFPDPEACDDFLERVCTMQWHGEIDRGQSFTAACEQLSGRFPQFHDAIFAWRDRWREMFSGVIAETEQAITDLAARGVPQFGLSNMSLEAWPDVRAMSPAFDLLSDIVLSGAEGCIKPDPEIYRIACARAGLAPSDLLFIDDNAANIAAARTLGFAVHRFEDRAALRPALIAHGLL